jgi:subtilisin family serine protease
MNRDGALAICLVFFLVFSFPLAPFTSNYTDATHNSSVDDPLKQLKKNISEYKQSRPPTVDHEVEIVVKMEKGSSVPESSEFTIERVYTKKDQRFMRGSISMTEVRSLLNNPRMQAVRITSTQPIYNGRVASGVNVIGADSLHKRGITGENVTVGIIDSDFWIGHPAIFRSVGAYRSFNTTSTSNWRHGTAVASVVIDTAPSVNLHLAAIGPTTTAEEYAAAVEWLQQSGVDIIVDAGSYYAQPGDGTGPIAQIAANASSETVFITSVGNYAQQYWAGNYSSDKDTGKNEVKWVTSHTGAQANPLNNGEPFSGDVRLTLRWDGWPKTAVDYDLYLIRKQPGDDVVVAKATGHNGRPFEYLEATVPRGQYYVSIQVVTGPEPGNTSHLELFANRELRYRSLGGLTAPATAPSVIAVGASENGTVEPFSVRGADIVAPDAVALAGMTVEGGTSFSTSYVAGTAALLLSANPGLTAEEVRSLLKSSADNIGSDGIDPRSGYGRVNATRAIKLANKTNAGGFTEPRSIAI